MVLTAAQVQTRHDLHTMEIGFPIGDGPEGHEDLIEDFTTAAEAIVDITSAQDVVNKVFDKIVLRGTNEQRLRFYECALVQCPTIFIFCFLLYRRYISYQVLLSLKIFIF